MDDQALNRAFEINHAGWWTLDGVIRGEAVKADPRFDWTCDPAGGGACLHRIRLGEGEVEAAVEPLIDVAAVSASAIWAYASPEAEPEELIERLRALGFQHACRFPVIGMDLARLPPSACMAGSTVTPLVSLECFDKQTPLPGVGPITTKARRAVVKQLQARYDHAPERVCRIASETEGVVASVATAFLDGGIAGLYDVATLEGYQDRGLARQTVVAALAEARARGASHAATIPSDDAMALYGNIGFRPAGWLSFLYYSKTKLQKRRTKLAS